MLPQCWRLHPGDARLHEDRCLPLRRKTRLHVVMWVWIDGIVFSIVFGWVSGVVLGLVYNRLIRR
jgi:hypothetical protein